MPVSAPGRLRADTMACRGAEMLRMRRLPEALSCCVDGLRFCPQSVEALDMMGTVLYEMGDRDKALQAWSRAVEMDPQHLLAWVHLGNALAQKERFDDAILCFRAALNIDATNAAAHNNLGAALKETGRMKAALAEFRLAIEAKSPVAYSNLLYALYFHAGSSALEILEEHRRWNERIARPITDRAAPHVRDHDTERPLRVGYVGAHFRNHCQTYFTLPLLRHHDRSRYQIHLYSDTHPLDTWSVKLSECVDAWHDIAGLSDEEAAERIRRDRIDVLVDLSLHMVGSRLLLFARRPAPVQVTWLAYPGTTGLSAMDYRITDPFLDPPGQNDGHYVEKSIRLPHTFWCFEPLETPTPIAPPPCLRQGHVTFGCFNNFSKLNTFTIERWARVMRAVEGSTLLLRVPDGITRKAVAACLVAHGVAHERVVFVPQIERTKYLEQYNQIDVALDTLPANGHTTTLDALWMGVPVVTRAGDTAISRGALSLLSNLGLSDLAAETDDEFVAKAVRLARDTERRRALRIELRPRMEKSPLMDGAAFAAQMEDAFRAMWRTWCVPTERKAPSPPEKKRRRR